MKQSMTCGDTNQVTISTAARVTKHKAWLQEQAGQEWESGGLQRTETVRMHSTVIICNIV